MADERLSYGLLTNELLTNEQLGNGNELNLNR